MAHIKESVPDNLHPFSLEENAVSKSRIPPELGVSKPLPKFFMTQNIIKIDIALACAARRIDLRNRPQSWRADLRHAGLAPLSSPSKKTPPSHALSRLQNPDMRLTVTTQTPLEFPFDQIPFTKVVAQLPYHITTPLLEKSFKHLFSPSHSWSKKKNWRSASLSQRRAKNAAL